MHKIILNSEISKEFTRMDVISKALFSNKSTTQNGGFLKYLVILFFPSKSSSTDVFDQNSFPAESSLHMDANNGIYSGNWIWIP